MKNSFEVALTQETNRKVGETLQFDFSSSQFLKKTNKPSFFTPKACVMDNFAITTGRFALMAAD